MDFDINHIPCDFFTNNHYNFYNEGPNQICDFIISETKEQKLDILKRLIDGELIGLWACEYHYNIKNRKMVKK